VNESAANRRQSDCRSTQPRNRRSGAPVALALASPRTSALGGRPATTQRRRSEGWRWVVVEEPCSAEVPWTRRVVGRQAVGAHGILCQPRSRTQRSALTQNGRCPRRAGRGTSYGPHDAGVIFPATDARPVRRLLPRLLPCEPFALADLGDPGRSANASRFGTPATSCPGHRSHRVAVSPLLPGSSSPRSSTRRPRRRR
jgi:hypothetical protein